MRSGDFCPEMDTQFEELYDERPREEIYFDLLMEVCDVSSEAQRILELEYADPEHILLILDDCFKKIESLCSI